MELITVIESNNINLRNTYLSNPQNEIFASKAVTFMTVLTKAQDVNFSNKKAWASWIENRLSNDDKAQPRELSGFFPWLEEDKQKATPTEIYYYFRIQSSFDTDVSEFFYYALMLQSTYIPIARITAYLVPPKNESVHAYFNRFTDICLLLPDDVFYSCFVKNPNGNFTNLQREKRYPSSKFIPIIEISESTYRLLIETPTQIKMCPTASNEKKPLSEQIAEIFPDNDDATIKKVFAVSNSIISAGLSGRRSVEEKRTFTETLCNFIQTQGGITALGYLIFAITLNAHISDYKIETVNYWLNDCMDMTPDLIDAIAQVLENIVHHSSLKKGLFMLRGFEAGTAPKYISKFSSKLKEAETQKKSSTKLGWIQILIADTNQANTIISHFLQKEKHKSLEQIRDEIHLSDFFDIFEDNAAVRREEFWKKYRRDNPTRCLGLPKLATELLKLDTPVFVRSEASYSSTKDKQFWMKDVSEKYSTYHFIPGTLFRFVVTLEKLQTLKKEKEKQSNKSIFRQTPESMAKFLDYSQSDFSLSLSSLKIFSTLDESEKSQEKKDEASDKSRVMWDELYFRESKDNSKKYVYFIDVSSFSDCAKAPWYEPFCKGFLKSKWCASEEKKKYIGFISDKSKTLYEEFSRTSRASLLPPTYQLGFIEKFPDAKDTETSIPRYKIVPDHGAEQIEDRFPWENYTTNYIDRVLQRKAEVGLLDLGDGYKLENTHIMLGSKVHIDTFYEMALYFTSAEATRLLAFELCRELLANTEVKEALLRKETTMLYGYASYSRHIINFLFELLKAYFEEESEMTIDHLVFAIFLPTHSVAEKKSFPLEDAYIRNVEKIKNKDVKRINVVKIVPISSTQTTFQKMQTKLQERLKKEPLLNEVIINEICNLTIFWVRESSENPKDKGRATLERPYWSKMDPIKREITPLSDKGKKIRYIASAYSNWQDPLTCELCYPSQGLGWEKPLIATDPSSTIPAQQYFPRGFSESRGQGKNDENEKRINLLYKHVKYGHFKKGENHFQFIIDMPHYLKEVEQQFCKDDNSLPKENIKEWLESLRSSSLPENITIIVTPKHPSNVEFVQHVNSHVYGGFAHVFELDSEKHFRSNVIAEYSGALGEIGKNARLEGAKISFVFVDVSVASGKTYHRLNSLIKSLKNVFLDSLFKSLFNLPLNSPLAFEKIFVLVNRLSKDSKRDYVKLLDDFHAYADLGISHLRTYGDSCVCCRLQARAESMYKKSSTPHFSEHWQGKMYKLRFNTSKDDDGQAFRRLFCSHYAGTRLSPVRGQDYRNYFEAIKALFDEVLAFDQNRSMSSVAKIYSNLDAACENNELLIVDLVKTLSRPFLSFDYRFQDQSVDFLMYFIALILTDFDTDEAYKILIKSVPGNGHAKQLFTEERKEYRETLSKKLNKIINDEMKRLKLLFVLIKALSELHINFITRKNIIELVVSSVEGLKNCKDYLWRYARHIMCVMHSGSDGRKALRLEFLLQKGLEVKKDLHYADFEGDKYARKFLPDNFISEVLFLENADSLYSGIEKIYNEHKPYNDALDAEELMSYLMESHMRDFCRFLLLDQTGVLLSETDENYLNNLKVQVGTSDLISWIKANVSLLSFLEETPSSNSDGSNDVLNKKYESLQQKLSAALSHEADSIDVNFFAKKSLTNDWQGAKYFSVGKSDKDENLAKEFQRNLSSLEKNIGELDSKGFHVSSDFVIIKLNNHANKLNTELDATIPVIEPIYIFWKFTEAQNDCQLFIIRNLLMYRRLLIEWIEEDFSNNAMSVFSTLQRASTLLSIEKAGIHISNSEVDRKQIYLLSPEEHMTNEETHWLLLKSYVDTKIARLYRAYVASEYLQEFKFEKLYRSEYSSEQVDNFKKQLLSASEILENPVVAEFIPPFFLQPPRNEPHAKSRYNYFEALTKVIDFKKECGESLSSLNDLKLHLSEFKCKTRKHNGKNWGYCAEVFTCIFLDFCYSALVYGRNWKGKIGNPQYRGIVDYYSAITSDSTRWPKQEVRIYQKKDKLILFNPITDSPTSQQKASAGLSSLVTRWYIEKLWEYESENARAVQVVAGPTSDGKKYKVELPILEKEDNE